MTMQMSLLAWYGGMLASSHQASSTAVLKEKQLEKYQEGGKLTEGLPHSRMADAPVWWQIASNVWHSILEIMFGTQVREVYLDIWCPTTKRAVPTSKATALQTKARAK